MRIDVINYSSRKNGNGYHIAEYIKGIILRENRECDLIDFSRFFANACGKCNYECFDSDCVHKNDEIYNAYRKILKADMVISVIPIYGGLPCSNFFVFNERAQGAFRDEEFEQLEEIRNKYIIIGNTGVEITKKIIGENDNHAKEEDFLVISSNEVGERSIKGNLMEYDRYREKINKFVAQKSH